VVSGGVVVVNSKFGGSCKEALRDDVYEALFPRSLSQKHRLRQACTVKQASESHSLPSVQGRAVPKRQIWKRMSTVQYARLGKEKGSLKSARAKQVKSFGVRRVPPASGVEVDANAMSGPMRPGTKPCL
jgi:hypothetical protein